MADTAVDVHLPAGHLTSAQVQLLAELAHTHGGGELHLTAHAQLQVRGDHTAIAAAVTAAGLTVDVPTRARLLVSPLSGRIGGHHDLRDLTAAVIAHLDDRPVAAGTVLGLDDGTGDIVALAPTVAVLARPDGRFAVIRDGADTGVRVVPDDAADALLTPPTDPTGAPEPVPEQPRPPIGWLDQPDGAVTLAGGLPGGILPARLAEFLAAVDRPVIVTPWRSVLLCDLDEWTAEQVVRVLAPMGLIFDADSPHLH
ncbi:precorrin-3B synthase [Rhodococcus rhodochrous]|uniref:Precorrin-3B synthase n=1 Tax=Rhodococcus rhodochrous TaxID=1829 RepID=A0AAW4XJF1_RHORH|nr:precorrin-3B synthase [Rhodococcus rhodochrous]MCD2113311.1 precorrin-3B synthase [Rhodococcus rhodochrous]